MANKIVVLGGGNSPERDISIKSAKSIEAAAKTAGFKVLYMDTKDGYDQLDNVEKTIPILPILHGIGGEDGEVQREMESRQLLFLGSGSRASIIAFDKWLTRLQLQKNNIIIPEGYLVDKNEYYRHELKNKPHVLKACRNGSSIGTYIVKNASDIDANKVDEVFSFGNRALIEEMIQGIEITTPVLGDKALPTIEIIPPQGKEFDYENKYNGQTKEICPPEHLPDDIIKRAEIIALKTHKSLDCLHLSRTDMIVTASGDIYVLEINTMPGMTDQSLYPKSAAVAGISFPKLVEIFVSLAKDEKRYN